MVPVLELRGSIPVGLAAGEPLWAVLAVSILGNLIPVPFIIICIRKIFLWLRKKSKHLETLVEKLEARGREKAKVVYKYKVLGLFLLVAIPLPGTGAWTGALVAALLDLRLKTAVPAIFAGVVTAGILMVIISYGVGALFL
ncbi:MAG: small multidrug export protein [Clostridiales bacterium]|nr:small multidrug export protein [Clostridiales bacterium]MBQ3107495.1 small multi-drug export protein [Bacillota bacterium]